MRWGWSCSRRSPAHRRPGRLRRAGRGRRCRKDLAELAASYATFRERGADVRHPLGGADGRAADLPGPSRDPRALPGGPARGPIRPRARAGRGPRSLADRPAAGLCRGAVLGPDPAAPCPPEENLLSAAALAVVVGVVTTSLTMNASRSTLQAPRPCTSWPEAGTTSSRTRSSSSDREVRGSRTPSLPRSSPSPSAH